MIFHHRTRGRGRGRGRVKVRILKRFEADFTLITVSFFRDSFWCDRRRRRRRRRRRGERRIGIRCGDLVIDGRDGIEIKERSGELRKGGLRRGRKRLLKGEILRPKRKTRIGSDFPFLFSFTFSTFVDHILRGVFLLG